MSGGSAVDAVIEQVCVGMPAVVRYDGREVETGIWKSPVAGRVRVNALCIEGDGQADLSVHGGYDKAVYVYAYDHYAAWAEELGRDALESAQFGENFMVSGVDESRVHVGDRFRFGSVTAIVAQPRLPCYKLGIRMGDQRFPARFLKSGRLGFYLRIESEGETGAGDAFERVEAASHGITITQLWQIAFGGGHDPSDAARCLDEMPYLDAGWQRRLRVRAGIGREDG